MLLRFLVLAAACISSSGGQTPIAEPLALSGKGLAQHPFLYCGEWQQRGKSDQSVYIVRDGKVVWSYSIPRREELGDCTMLSNGNIVFSRRFGASEVTPEKKIVWNYDAPPKTEIHTAYPADKDRVPIVQNGNPAKLLPIHKASGKVQRELELATRVPDGIHGQFRHIRMTKAGTFLVAHMDLGKVVEYDADGKEIWPVVAPSAWAAVRLTDGNTLIDNWPGGLPLEEWPKVVQLIEVTRDKKVVWALRDWTTLGPASATQLLDEPGVPENGDLQR